MAQTFKYGNGIWANKKGSSLAYTDLNSNYKPLPFNFERSSSATRTNKEGLIEVVDREFPRIDYKDNAKGALLLEPQSTNYLTYSEDFSQSAWSKAGSGTGVLPIVTANYGISPSGELNASRVQFNKGSGTTQSDYSALYDTLTVPSGIDSTKSIYVKSATSEEYDLVLYGTSDASGSNVKKIRVTTEWQRFDVFKTLTGTSTGIAIGLREISVSGLSNTADVLVWGAQVENQSYATSYIPNYGTAAGVTRSEDVGGSTGDLSSVVNSQEGTFMFEGSFLSIGGRVSLNSSTTTWSDRITILAISDTQIKVILKGGNVGEDATFTVPNIKTNGKLAIRWIGTNVVGYYNGTQVFSKANNGGYSAGILDRISMAGANGTSNKFTGKIKQLRIDDEYLSDAEMVKLTTL
jgi:hypothetical protein